MEQAALKNPEGFYHTDMSVGEILRRTRVHYGQSLTDVERAIRVRASQIDAIENNETDKLPGRVYAIGFVRSYAEYLGLDGAKIVDLFKRQQGNKPRDPSLDFPVPASESKVPPIWLVLASLVLTFVVPYVAWSFLSDETQDAMEISAVPAHLKADSFSLVDGGDTQEIYGPALPRSEIFINVTEDSWVEVKDSQDQVLLSKVLEAGEQYFIPNRPDLSITMGNAGAIQFEAAQGQFVPFGGMGEAKTDIPLDLEYLREYFAAGPVAPTTSPEEQSLTTE